MVIKTLTTTSFFSWKYAGFIGIFITSFGWTFYLSYLIMVSIVNNYDFFTASLESLGASGVLMFIGIHGTISFIISYCMYKRQMLRRKQYLVILLIASIIGTISNYRIFL